jgi:hypothetical protein
MVSDPIGRELQSGQQRTIRMDIRVPKEFKIHQRVVSLRCE